MTVTDEMLMAYVDGELDAAEAAAVALAAAGARRWPPHSPMPIEDR